MASWPFESSFENEVTLYAAKFARPVFFGQSPLVAFPGEFANGTATLVKLQGRYLVVTCHHVLESYRAKLAIDPQTVFQVGNLPLASPVAVLSESPYWDLAVIDVTEKVHDGSPLEAGQFAEPWRWPPGDVSVGDICGFAGFPGALRNQVSPAHMVFLSASTGTSEVVSVSEESLCTKFDLNAAEVVAIEGVQVGSFGGLSGGPVFVWRTNPIFVAELVGFIVEYQEALDVLVIRRSRCLGENGILLGHL